LLSATKQTFERKRTAKTAIRYQAEREQRLGANLLAFRLASFGVGGTFAVIGFFVGTVRLGHVKEFLRMMICQIIKSAGV
jgi:hypothetical protein